MSRRHGERAKEPRRSPSGWENANRRAEVRVVGEVGELLPKITGVPDALERPRVARKIAVDQTGCLTGPAEVADPTSERRQKPDLHQRRCTSAYTASSRSRLPPSPESRSR